MAEKEAPECFSQMRVKPRAGDEDESQILLVYPDVRDKDE
jgi:hypothetical protein